MKGNQRKNSLKNISIFKILTLFYQLIKSVDPYVMPMLNVFYEYIISEMELLWCFFFTSFVIVVICHNLAISLILFCYSSHRTSFEYIWNKTSLLDRLIQKKKKKDRKINAKLLLTCRAFLMLVRFFWMINWFWGLVFVKTNNTSTIWSMCVHYRINFTIWYISVKRVVHTKSPYWLILMSVICRNMAYRIDLLILGVFISVFLLFSLFFFFAFIHIKLSFRWIWCAGLYLMCRYSTFVNMYNNLNWEISISPRLKFIACQKIRY